MKKSYLYIFFCFLIFSSFPVYAETTQYPQVYSVIEMNENHYSTQPKYHWEEENGNWYYKDNTGQIKYGKFYDEYGDIYDTGDNADGKIIISGKNAAGEEFDGSGRLVNQAMKNNENYEKIASDFEDGKSIKFNDFEDFVDFLEYYSTQYSLFKINASFSFYNDTMTSEIGENSYDREAVIEQVISKFGRLVGSNDYEKIYDACEKINETLDYDLANKSISLKDCLDKNSGVCWHYTKIVSLLLDDAGIYNEAVVGKYDESVNAYHMWLRCKVDGKWVYVDPTQYKSIGWSYHNINYKTYVDDYESLHIVNV